MDVHDSGVVGTGPRAERALSLLFFAGLAGQIWAFHGLRHDDAYITFRYGQNLASGNGMVFNPGEHIMGSTSPGHILLSALVDRLIGDKALPSVMAGIGCLGWTLQAAAIFLLLRDVLGQVGAGLAAGAFALGSANSAFWVALETNVAFAAALWAILSAVRDRWLLAATLSALACLERPDNALLAVLLGLMAGVKLRGRAWKPVLIFLLIVSPWLIFATLSFGSPLPQSAITKFHVSRLGAYFHHEVQQAALELIPTEGPDWVRLLVAWGFALPGAVVLVYRSRRLWILIAFGLLHALAYLFLRPSIEQTWHLYPEIVVFEICAFSGAVFAVQSLRQQWQRRAAAVVFSLFLAEYGMRTLTFYVQQTSLYWNGARDRSYQAVSEFLQRNADPADVVGAVEVGTIAYKTGLRMHDLSGLITVHPVVGGVGQSPYRWLVLRESEGERGPTIISPKARFDSDGFVVSVFDLSGK